MVYGNEMAEWKLKGWAESPADFIDMKKHAEEIGLPQTKVEDAYASVKRDVNEKINIHTMNATELADFCTRKSDGKNYNRRLGKAALLEVAERIVQGEIIVGVDDMDDIEVVEDDDSVEDNPAGVQ